MMLTVGGKERGGGGDGGKRPRFVAMTSSAQPTHSKRGKERGGGGEGGAGRLPASKRSKILFLNYTRKKGKRENTVRTIRIQIFITLFQTKEGKKKKKEREGKKKREEKEGFVFHRL